MSKTFTWEHEFLLDLRLFFFNYHSQKLKLVCWLFYVTYVEVCYYLLTSLNDAKNKIPVKIPLKK